MLRSRRFLIPALALVGGLLLVMSCGSRPITMGGDGGPGPTPTLTPGATPAPGLDGGARSCYFRSECAAGEYCDHPGCGFRGQGRCVVRPTECPALEAPVCGCDGKKYGNSCLAAAAGVSLADDASCPLSGDDQACAGLGCRVLNDCCACDAVPGNTPNESCDIMCKQPACGGIHLYEPLAYCLRGRCLLATAATGCATDADCVKTQDCCRCLAVPKSAPIISCSANCEVDACTAIGLGAARAACAGGLCKLVMP